MLKSSLSCFVLVVALAVSGATPAQDQSEEEIVVRAQMSAEELGKASRAMTRTLTGMTVGDQVARWAMPVCARVEGLDPPLSQQVRQSLLEIGKAARVKVAKGRCNPNVIVVFSKDAAGLATSIADRLPAPGNRDGKVERTAFTGARGPLRWESLVSSQDLRHGPKVNNSAALMNSGDWNQKIDLPTVDSTDPSLIRKHTKAVVDGMMVVVDGNAAEGLELAQIAEYIAMVVFARPPLSANFEGYPSILNLARYQPPGPSPLRLSEWDRAYLAALYSTPIDRSASAARSLIAQRMARELAKN